MVELTIQLGDETVAWLRERAQLENKSVEQIATEQLEAGYRYVPGTPPIPLGAGQFNSGDPTLARRTREVIRKAVEDGEWP